MRAGHPILEHRRRLEAEGFRGPWLALFDIDSTLMDTGPRSRAILEGARDSLPGLSAAWSSLDLSRPSWDVREPLRRAGVGDEDLHNAVHSWWKDRFFTDEWLAHDRPYPGVAAFLVELKAAGFALAYLTGRHSPGMEAGTRKSFASYGLPAGAEETFFFKPVFDMADLEFKTSVCERIRAMGTLVVSVDNEPANVNLFHAAFPRAITIWIDTVTSPCPEPLRPGIVRRGPEWFLDR